MGHRQEMTDKQRGDWDLMQYQAKLDANKGSNYQYWNDSHEKLTENGWEVYVFGEKNVFEGGSTGSEYKAKEVVEELRKSNHFARIVCGYNKNVQRQKRYSVIYKKKK